MGYDLAGFRVTQGTSAAETLIGNSGKDAIYANGGADTLNGGRGIDVLFGSDTGNTTFQFSNDATWGSGWTTRNAGDPTGSGTGESYSLTGYARSYDTFVGSGSNNVLQMGDGNLALLLDDNTGSPVDAQRLHNIQTIVMGSGGQIVDLTSSRFTYGNVTIVGGANADVIWSNAGNDTLSGGNGGDKMWGGSGNDLLDGGSGADDMAGGTGNDTYRVDNKGDVVIENAGEGRDTVEASISYTLADNFENLTLLGSANLDGTGNSAANVLIGNSGDNTLDGGNGNDTLDGSLGSDVLIGGQGNDTYYVDDAGDVVIEAADGGKDVVYSTVALTLGANVEVLRLGGTDDLRGEGNELDNELYGNAGNNRLLGQDGNDRIYGGNGQDTIYGGNDNDILLGEKGNDRLYGDDGLDILNGGENRDTLFGGAEFDWLYGGGDNDTLYGEDGDDRIYGDGGNDIIQGGAGDDLLAGGQIKGAPSLGDDTFVWDRGDVVDGSGAQVGYDRIVDFRAGDKLDFSDLIGSRGGDLADLIHVDITSKGAVVSVDMGGGIGFVDVVLLQGRGDLTLQDLIDNGWLIT